MTVTETGAQNTLQACISCGIGWVAWLQVGGSSAVALLPLVLIFVIFYFLLILPQQRKQKKWQQMLDALKNGDRVVTSGGVRGTVIALRDDCIHLRVPPDNLRLEVVKSAVVSVNPPEESKS